MINTDLLKEKPFYLTEEQRRNVADKIEKMPLNEKIGQLFFLMHYEQMSNEQVLRMVQHIQPGGVMLRPASEATVTEIIDLIKDTSLTVPFISANLEHGVNGIVKDGASFGSAMQLSAANDPELVREAANFIGVESGSLGVNMTFSPVVDINYHCLNPITDTRAFGDDAEHVTEMSKSFCEGLVAANVMPVIKHFPGDGVDDRDHHVLPSVNSLPFSEWDDSYGAVYKGLIEHDIPCIMAGHILLPSYERMVQPDIKDNEILPATLSKNLLNGLLREHLGFNGLIITDATGMCGFNSFATRKESMVNSVNAGCDMLLFTKSLEEDYAAIYEAVSLGIITKDRLHEALVRILGMKERMFAKDKEQTNNLSFDALAEKVFDQSITLVKNNDNLLPIRPESYRKILLIPLGNEEHSKTVLAKELEEKGFHVTLLDNTKIDFDLLIGKAADLKAKYDMVIYSIDYRVKSNQTSNRIEWGMPAGQFMPWFIKEIPVVMISFGNPYHLYDAPRIPTYINAYSNVDKNIEWVVKKLVGESEFKGISPVDAFCGRFDTRC